MNVVVGLAPPVCYILFGLWRVFKRDTYYGLWSTAGGLAMAMLAIKAFETPR